MKKNLLQYIKKDTFIYKYMEYCNDLETAQDFDFWGALWIVSMLCNRNVVIDRPNSPLFSNFYITLIAESGIARKSTAINFAKDILEKLIDKTDNIDIITSNTSIHKFNYILTKSSTLSNKCLLAVNCPEFITFYKNKNIIECFTDLYDCPKERKGYGTFTNGDINIRDVFVSSYTGSTPNYYFKAVSKDEIEGGFTSRNIIVYAGKGKRRIAWGTVKNITEEVIEEGKQLKEFIGNRQWRITLSTEAIHRFTRWYKQRRLSDTLYLRTFESREQDFVLKLACLLTINEKCKEISKLHIDYAIEIIKYYKLKASSFFKENVFEEELDDLSRTIHRIREIIRTKAENGIKHRDLYLRVHNSCTNDDFNYIINIMHELNMIEILQPYGSKAYIYRATKNLFKINIDKIIEKISNEGI